MITKERADLRLNCIYAAKNILGIEGGASYSIEGKQEKSSTKAVLDEAKKLFEWVSGKEEN